MITERDAVRLSFDELESRAYAAPNDTQVPIIVLRLLLKRIERVISFETIRYAEKTSTSRKK